MTELKKYSDISSLWLDYKNGLKYYIFKKVKNEEIANDLSHEVLMKVYNSCCSSVNIKNVRSWMFQIAHNTTIDYLKKQNKFTDNVPEDYDNDEYDVYQEANEIVKPLMQLLPEKYAIPLQLSEIEELKQKEVAQKLNLSLTATKSRIQRARNLLKEKIIECGNLEKDEKGNLISLEIRSDCKPIQKSLRKKNQ
ncbi:sigma-70 family RNA polymerase sigma factor [Gaetbulibacter aquiaggeris]|uniref:Sigma-70 family RNA polymerase sigma factor n=1 Tax=Gaetbulibacter aquiaggeris TaxID=1735373 RepID=A0ABW7MKY5_9FLAO